MMGFYFQIHSMITLIISIPNKTLIEKKNILIVDDHPLMREGLKAIIGLNAEYEVVGEADNGRQAMHLATKLQPDIAVIDISLPDISGIELTREIRSCLPATRVLMLSMHSRIDFVAESFQAGATGYLVKESAADGLLKGIACVASGQYFLDRSLSYQVIQYFKKSSSAETQIPCIEYGTLTPREKQVMRLLAEGHSTKTIAEKLFISPKTVENHRTNIMKKLGLHSVVELVHYCARSGLIDLDLWKY
jgi:DNA-binding NarL/FixJ family response regulator